MQVKMGSSQNHFRAVATGAKVSEVTGQPEKLPFDLILMFSNINSRGPVVYREL